MIIYLSGPMSGIPELNYPTFNRVTKQLRDQGHTVLNPAELIPPAEPTHANYMRLCAQDVAIADAIALLPGWEKSKGARVEVAIAAACGLEFLSADTLEPIIVGHRIVIANKQTTRG